MREAGLAAQLAGFVAAIDSLPPATVHAVRRHTLDTLGVAIAGASRPEPQAALGASVAAFGSAGTTPLWGSARHAAPAVAALVNGTAAHALELDDASGCDHSGAVVVPAVFAALDLPGGDVATDDDLIAAIVAGYEVGRRVMEASGGYDGHNTAGWHSTGTCGAFGAAAAVARLLRCDAATTTHALGIACSFACGTWAFLADGAMTKRLHAGHAAGAGLLAVELARHGLVGPAQAFEAPWGGFFATYTPGAAQPERLLADLGTAWRIHLSSIKPYASCRGTHAAVEAMLALRSEVDAMAIEAMTVDVTPTVEKMCRGKTIDSFVDAQMSLPYAVAVAALHGDADLPRFDPAHRGSAALRQLMDRVQVRADSSLPSNVAARLALRTRDGRELARAVDVPLGSPTNPLPQDRLSAKFHSLAGPVLGAVPAQALEQRIMGLGGRQAAAGLRALLRTTS